MKHIIFAVNKTKPGALDLAEHLKKECLKQGCTVDICTEYPLAEDRLLGCDLCCVVGGDGTLLSVVTAAVKSGTPVWGINLGKLGFMASEAREAEELLPDVLSGNCCVSERRLLECRCANGESRLALNDFVIKKLSTRLTRLRVSANGKPVNEYYSDGLIFATPTGSTAYNLSAGGPIIHPSAPVMAMTPICPHTLSNRSLIFSECTELSIECCDVDKDLVISGDGGICFTSAEVFPLEIHIAEKARFNLIVNPKYSHFRLVHEKLGWGREN